MRVAALRWWVVDLDERTVTWSAAMCSDAGLPARDTVLSLEAALAHMHPEDRADAAAKVGSETDDGSGRMVGPTGEVRRLRYSARLIRDDHSLWVATALDVTREDELDTQLELTRRAPGLTDRAAFVELIGNRLSYEAGGLWCADGPEPWVAQTRWRARGRADLSGLEAALDAIDVGSTGPFAAVVATGEPLAVAGEGTRPSVLALRTERLGGGPALAVWMGAPKPVHRRLQLPLLRAMASGLLVARDGQRVLSARELEVLRLASDGASGPEIAQRIHVSPETVKTHFDHAYEKLGVRNRAAAVAVALRSGLID